MKFSQKLAFAAASFVAAIAVFNSNQSAHAYSINFVNSQPSGAETQYNYNLQIDPGNVFDAGSLLQVFTTVSPSSTGVLPTGTGFIAVAAPPTVPNPSGGFISAFNASQSLTNSTASPVDYGFYLTSASNIPASIEQVTFSAFNSATGTTTVTQQVPEPITIGGSAIALGVGLWLKRKKATLSA